MRNPFLPGCLVVNPDRLLSAFASVLATELVILVMMFTGLQKRRMSGSSSGMWRKLYHQGLVWLILAVITELPAVVRFFDLEQSVIAKQVSDSTRSQFEPYVVPSAIKHL